MAAVDPHLQLVLQYAQGVFDRDTVQGFAARLVRVLRQLADPAEPTAARIDLLDPAERDRLLTEFNDTAAPHPGRHGPRARRGPRRPAPRTRSPSSPGTRRSPTAR
ncbi:hypothetical protein [Streptomyces sp. KL116D]|uniref:hypothetical protein n=1 Tax=Streptomyces sp. KL116D TaxID=3045152 RepID=UPI003557D8BF